MNVTLRTPRMTREQFLDWVERQETPYEFDGFEPVAMTGGSLGHNLICHNIYDALRSRLRNTDWTAIGPDVAVATVASAVRFPDVVVTARKLPTGEKLAPAPVVIFEVVSPTTTRIDRIVKVREYAAVPSVRRYILVEDLTVGLTVLARSDASQPWLATAVGPGESLDLPEIGLEVPVDEFYWGLDLPEQTETGR